ncbi:MAG: DegV family protein [Candidatus Limnocylindrales bacterium]
MTVAIVTDSGSDLTPAFLKQTGITQVPLSVSFGEETFLSPDEMSAAAFWERLRDPSCPFAHTAAPSVGLFRQAFEEAFAHGQEAVVCVCLSEALSATIKHAQMAREMLPDRQIFIVDSRSASMGVGALALRGADLAAAGTSGAEIHSRLTILRDRLDLYVGLETLEYLRKGGRISHAKAAIGGLLSIKPIVTIDAGVVVVADQPRTRSKATERVIELLTDRPVTELHALYSPPVDVDAFVAAVLAHMPEPAPKVVTAQIIGPVIGAHVGPGAYGAILVREY